MYLTLIDIPLLQMVLGCLVERDVLEAEYNPVKNSIYIIFFTGFVFTLLIAFLFNRHFAGNIERLYSYTGAISESKTDLEICVSGKDELLYVNKSINQMVESLREKTETISTLFYFLSHNISNKIMLINNKTDKFLDNSQNARSDLNLELSAIKKM